MKQSKRYRCLFWLFALPLILSTFARAQQSTAITGHVTDLMNASVVKEIGRAHV